MAEAVEMVKVRPSESVAAVAAEEATPKDADESVPKILTYLEARPLHALRRALAPCCLLVVLLLFLVASGFQLFRFSTLVPMYLWEHPTKVANDAVAQATAQANTEPAGSSGSSREREVHEFSLSIVYLLDSPDDLQAVLHRVEAFEERIVGNARYADFCQLVYASDDDDGGDGQCARHASFVHFFDPAFFLPATQAYTADASWYNSALLVASDSVDPTADVDDVQIDALFDTVLDYYAHYNPAYANATTAPFSFLVNTTGFGVLPVELFNPAWLVLDSAFGYVLGADGDYALNDNVAALRTEFFFGAPRFDSDGTLMETEGEDFDTQESDLGAFLFEEFQDMLEDGLDGGGARVFWDGRTNGMLQEYTAAHMVTDGLLAIGSFLFVFSYITLTTGSLWLASAGMAMVLLNMVPSILAYRLVAGYTYFGVLNLLSVFILMALGADDMFVFLEAWQKVRVEHPGDSVARQMHRTLQHAGTAMATTSATTAVCFLANAGSSFPAVASFGTYVFWLVVFNFLTTVTVFPAIVAVHAYYFEGGARHCRARPAAQRGYVRDSARSLGRVQCWFRDWFFDRVVRRGGTVVLVLFAALGVVYLAFAVQLEPDPETPALFDDDNNYIMYPDVLRENFARVDDPRRVKVRIVFGVEELNRDCLDADCSAAADPTIPSDLGWVEWDENIYDIAEPDSQTLLLDLCADAREGTEGVSAAQRMVKEADAFVTTPVRCWIESFRDYCGSNDIPFPYGKENSEGEWVADATGFEDHMYDWLGSPQSPSDVDYVAGQSNYDVWQDFLFAENVYGALVFRFFIIEVTLDATVTLPFDDGMALYDDWVDWLDSWRERAASVTYGKQDMFDSGFISAPAFHYYFLQSVMLQEAFSGIALSLAAAFVVLCVATNNWRIAVLSTGVLVFNVTGTIAAVVMQGWKLGILEGVVLVMVVGLSVDASIHLSAAYLEADSPSRAGRVQEMLASMAVSVLSGACSTIGAATFLLFADIVFLSKFGTVIFFIIIQSAVCALVLFSVILFRWGPEGSQGRLHVVVRGRALLGRVAVACRRRAAAWVDDEPVYSLVAELKEEVQSLRVELSGGVGPVGNEDEDTVGDLEGGADVEDEAETVEAKEDEE